MAFCGRVCDTLKIYLTAAAKTNHRLFARNWATLPCCLLELNETVVGFSELCSWNAFVAQRTSQCNGLASKANLLRCKWAATRECTLLCKSQESLVYSARIPRNGLYYSCTSCGKLLCAPTRLLGICAINLQPGLKCVFLGTEISSCIYSVCVWHNSGHNISLRSMRFIHDWLCNFTLFIWSMTHILSK